MENISKEKLELNKYYNANQISLINNIDNFKKSWLILFKLFQITDNDIDLEKNLKFKEIIQQLKQDESLDDYDSKKYRILYSEDLDELLLDVKLWILNIDIVAELDYGTYVYMFLKNNKMFNNSVAWYFCYRKGMTFSQHLGIVTHKLKERNKPFYFDLKNRTKEMFLYSFIEFYFNDCLSEE